MSAFSVVGILSVIESYNSLGRAVLEMYKASKDCSTETEELGKVWKDSFSFDVWEANIDRRGERAVGKQRKHIDRHAENSTYSTDQVQSMLRHHPDVNGQRTPERRQARSSIFNDWETSTCERDPDDGFIILYYAGHGKTRFDRCDHEVLPPIRKEQHDLKKQKYQDSVMWQQTELTDHDAEADILLMFDCCYAGLLSRSSEPSRSEALAAGTAGSLTGILGPKSLTPACDWYHGRCRSKNTTSLDIPFHLPAEDNDLLCFDLQCFDSNCNMVRDTSLHLAAQAHEDITSWLFTVSASTEKPKNGFKYSGCMWRLIGKKYAFPKGRLPASGFVTYALIDSVAEHLKDIGWHRSHRHKGDINGWDIAKSIHSSSWKNWMRSKISLIWISARPGSGKGTLMKSVNTQTISDLREWSFQQDLRTTWMFFPRCGSVATRIAQFLRVRSVLDESKDGLFAAFRKLAKAILRRNSSTSPAIQKLFWLLPMSTNVAAHSSWIPSLPKQFDNSGDHPHEHFAQGKGLTYPWICSLMGTMNERSALWSQYSKDPTGTCAAHGDAVVLGSALCFSVAALLLYRFSSNCRRRRVALITGVVTGSVISIGKGLRVMDILLQVLPVIVLLGMICNFIYDRMQCCRKVPWLEQTANCDHLKCSDCGQNCCSEKYKQQDW